MAPLSFSGPLPASTTALEEALMLYPGAESLDIEISCEAAYAEASLSGSLRSCRVPVRDNSSLKSAKLALYLLLSEIYRIRRPWGSMTGVKPQKKFTALATGSLGIEGALRFFRDTYDVSEEKAELLAETFLYQQSLTRAMPSACLYVHIPLCPARCSYCSFPSRVAEEGSSTCEEYLNSLCYELRELCGFLKGADIEVSCAYIGGGTPAILSERQLGRLLALIRESFPAIKEFTVEAGRSDVLSRAKLELLKSFGVSRVCINPQTFHERTLRAVGRDIPLTSFMAAFDAAKALGFCVNSDLIFGLPGESASDYEESLQQLISMAPENITIHSLCKKRTAQMTKQEVLQEGPDVSAAQGRAYSHLVSLGYKPYYLYKQKDAVSGAENVGYAKEGEACLYNIAMMGESSHIFGVGANAASNVLRASAKGGEVLQAAKIYNVKDLVLYNRDIESRTKEKLRKLKAALIRQA